MARTVKCQITGESGTSDIFYKAPNGKYYKSKELYDAWEQEKSNRQDIIELIATEFLGYVEGKVFPTFLVRKLKELEFYGYAVIKLTIERCKNSIDYAIQTKEFKNDNAKTSYIFAIIKNNINDVYKECQQKEKTAQKQSKQTDSFETIDEEILMNIGSKCRAKDIGEFLED
jgi:hypothetical protein